MFCLPNSANAKQPPCQAPSECLGSSNSSIEHTTSSPHCLLSRDMTRPTPLAAAHLHSLPP